MTLRLKIQFIFVEYIDFGERRRNSWKRLVTNKKTKRGLKAWIPAGVYPREDWDWNGR
jgi:hypothetical protein